MKTYRDSESVDFAIVGSGAAGGVIARELSQAGFSVVVFEQGPRLTLADFEHDELKYWFNAGLTNDVMKNPQTFRDDHSKRGERNLVRPSLYYARTVGGSSTHYTANYWRFREVDFDERSRLGSIAGTGFADWPLRYAELEPYYTKVEWEIGVSGLTGASPFDPPRSKPYPMPPLPVKSSGVLLERGARKLGLHPFPAPLAISSEHYRGRPRLRSLPLLPRLRLRSSSESFVADDDDPGGRGERTLRGSFRELRRAGRHGQARTCDGPALPRSRQARTISAGEGGHRVRERRGDAAPVVDVGHQHVPAGARELERTGRQVPDVQLQRAHARGVRARAQRVQERAVLARRARLLRQRSEARLLRRRWHRHAHGSAADRLGGPHRRCSAEIMEAAGAIKVTNAPIKPSTSSVHLLGTCRMGDDPQTSVVDRYHRSHDIPNLFVCDGSSLVTSGRGQPTLTIQALAFRAAEHIANFARRNEI